MGSLVGLAVPLAFFSLLAVERLLPGHPQPRVPGWTVKAILFFAMGGVLNALVPAAIARAVGGHTLLDLKPLGTWGGAAVAFLFATLANYWVHRLMHRWQLLWRWAHQLHHSAERVDIAGFAYSHPLELALVMASNALCIGLSGVGPEAALIAGLGSVFLGFFEHLNLRTPTWLGYLVQRPEAHSVHHQRGVHAYNYGLPLWDLAFGTWRNPAVAATPSGFWDGASAQTLRMLVGHDVGTPPR
jgi:sterol desaturase/sphingolipid hydroxylase (fatty acid hydroxylase superfamily)